MTTRTMFWVAATTSLSLFGCTTTDDGGPTGPTGDPIAQGLTVFTQSPDKGLTAMYAEGQDVVFLETVRTLDTEPAETHHSFLADGTAVNIDVRFSDMEDRDLIVSLESDYLPVGWDHGVPQYTRADIGRRAILGKLIQKATDSLSLPTAGIGTQMQTEVARVQGIGLSAPVEANPTPPERTADQAFGPGEEPGWFYRYFEVHKHWIGWPIAEHSASQWWNCESMVGCYGFQETSNHGDNSSSMGDINCSNVSPWIWQGYISAGDAGSCDWYSGYSACGMWGGNHNCHDDTKFEMKRVIGCGWYSNCNSAGCDVHAPSYCGC